MIIKHQHFEYLGKMVLERVVFEAPLRASEIMRDEACFIYAINGKSTMYGGTERHQLQSKEGVLIRCGNFINYWQEDEKDKPYEAIAVHFYPETLQKIFENKVPSFLTQGQSKKPKLSAHIKPHEAMESYIASLVYYFQNPQLASEELIGLKLKELVLLMHSINHQGLADVMHNLFNPAQAEFREIVSSKLFENLTLEDLAQLTNLSLSSFKRKFKEVFQDSPAHYIKAKRLEKAAELLKVSATRISSIGYDCGFNDLAHFSKSFAAHYGCRPSEYRNRYLDQSD